MAIYLPHLFSWVVVGGIWIHILSPDGGLVNELIKLFGGRPIPFFALDRWAKPLMIAAPIWKDMGFNAILYLAAIVGINPALYEAARIDGASRWRQVRHVTIPLLRPTMTVVLLLNLAGVLRIFDQIYVMRNGAIAREVDVLMTYVYDKGLVQFRMGFATAAAFLVIGATLALLYINDTAKYTLQIALSASIIESDATSRATFISPNVRMAGIVIALVPLIVIYPLAQKYFVEGVMLGSVKE